MLSLFNPIVEKERLNHAFKSVLKSEGNEPGRILLDEIFSCYKDVDGNFIEQFQTTGFDQRIFELYLFAYFRDIGFEIKREYKNPDFIVKKNNQYIAIEATTAGISSKIPIRKFTELSEEQRRDYLINEIPVRIGSPLFSKLEKQYWNLNQCQGLPFIIAIELFYSADSLAFSSSSLGKYLYGLDQKANYDNNGYLNIELTAIADHKIKSKEIPSGFFDQPGAEHVSAIIFTNSGTFPKFNRMGYYRGYYSSFIKMIREGTCYDYDRNASIPKKFIHDLDETINTSLMESWGQGIEIFYNPSAKIPLERGFFKDAAEHYFEDGKFYSDIPRPFHPFSSQTSVLCSRINLNLNDKLFIKITLSEFDYLLNKPERKLAPVKEISWVRSLDYSFIMCLVIDLIDNDYGYIIYGKKGNSYIFQDAKNSFECVMEASKSMLDIAEKLVQ